MKRRMMIMAAMGMSLAALAAPDGTAVVTLPEGNGLKEVVVSHASIANMATARRQSDLRLSYDTIPVNGDRVEFVLGASEPSRYSIELGKDMVADFYASPDENLYVDVKSLSPLQYVVLGTPLMDDMTSLALVTQPIEQQYYVAASSGAATEEQLRPIMEAYDKVIKDFITSKPDSPAVAYAILDLEGEDFLKAYDNLTPAAKKSIMMPFAEVNKPKVEKQVAAERKRAAMMSGDVEAPGFTLPDLDGKQISLSDFKGKWVVIDFWGSWCGWCIKGFPALKDAYKKYAGKLEVVGVDCNEPQEAWRAGVEKYKLPWVNVYNGDNPQLLEAYGIQGFPTKAIVDPEGKLVDVTVGEDPTFYQRLERFIEQ